MQYIYRSDTGEILFDTTDIGQREFCMLVIKLDTVMNVVVHSNGIVDSAILRAVSSARYQTPCKLQHLWAGRARDQLPPKVSRVTQMVHMCML